jgi:hypothetical protein
VQKGEEEKMIGRQNSEQIDRLSRVGFALLVGTGAGLATAIATGGTGIGIAVGLAAFLVFGLELS